MSDDLVGTPHKGESPLADAKAKLTNRSFPAKQEVLTDLMQWFIDARLAVNKLVMDRVLTKIDAIHTATDMANVACRTPRQLQRTFKQGAGGALVYSGAEDCAQEEARVAGAGGIIVGPKFSIGEFGWVTICEDTNANLFGFGSMA